MDREHDECVPPLPPLPVAHTRPADRSSARRCPRSHGGVIDGLQSLTQWEDAFNNPSGGMVRFRVCVRRGPRPLITRDPSLPALQIQIDIALCSSASSTPSRYAPRPPRPALAHPSRRRARQNIGSLCAYPFAPYVTDGLGRRPAILLGAALMLVATALQSAAHSVHMFIGARCVPLPFSFLVPPHVPALVVPVPRPSLDFVSWWLWVHVLPSRHVLPSLSRRTLAAPQGPRGREAGRDGTRRGEAEPVSRFLCDDCRPTLTLTLPSSRCHSRSHDAPGS